MFELLLKIGGFPCLVHAIPNTFWIFSSSYHFPLGDAVAQKLKNIFFAFRSKVTSKGSWKLICGKSLPCGNFNLIFFVPLKLWMIESNGNQIELDWIKHLKKKHWSTFCKNQNILKKSHANIHSHKLNCTLKPIFTWMSKQIESNLRRQHMMWERLIKEEDFWKGKTFEA